MLTSVPGALVKENKTKKFYLENSILYIIYIKSLTTHVSTFLTIVVFLTSVQGTLVSIFLLKILLQQS